MKIRSGNYYKSIAFIQKKRTSRTLVACEALRSKIATVSVTSNLCRERVKTAEPEDTEDKKQKGKDQEDRFFSGSDATT